MQCNRILCILSLAVGASFPVFPAIAQQPSIYQATLGETREKAGEINTEQMRKIVSDGSAIILDTRSHAEFINGHIPTAHNFVGSPAEIAAGVEKLAGGDKSKPLILYCNGPFCQASRRTSAQLIDAGFTNVRRYQLGMPVWRALGGPTQIELDGLVRIYKQDQTAVFLDAASAQDFSRRTLPRAANLPPEKAAKVQGSPMPLDDFNTRIIAFGHAPSQARSLADALSKRPWHNVVFYEGSFEAAAKALDVQ